MTRVLIESPYAGDIESNVRYARQCVLDSLKNHGEYPLASHIFYTQVLDDSIPEERELGISAGLAWRVGIAYAVFYVDRGWSSGMLRAKELYESEGIPYQIRTIAPVCG